MMQNGNNFGTINSSLDASETEGLIYMREEEKLAHDVYVTLYEKWGVPIFQNIAKSEDRHETKIETLLDRYQISDPVGDNPIGVFVNPDLQELYNTLVAQGSQSLTEALKVGVLIEETDIVDLQERIAQTDNADIQQVYEQLLSGSNNHLSAFTSNLSGETNAEDPLTGMQSNQMLVGDRQGDVLTGKPGNNYRVRGGDRSEYAADLWLNSLGQMNNYQVQNVQQILPSDDNLADPTQLRGFGNATEVIDLSQNDLAFGCSGNQDQIDIMTRMQANDWAAIA
jgi:hypothetical protein